MKAIRRINIGSAPLAGDRKKQTVFATKLGRSNDGAVPAIVLLVIVLILVFLPSLVSGRAEKSIITGPMILAAAGLLGYLAVPEVFLSFSVYEVSANPTQAVWTPGG